MIQILPTSVSLALSMPALSSGNYPHQSLYVQTNSVSFNTCLCIILQPFMLSPFPALDEILTIYVSVHLQKRLQPWHLLSPVALTRNSIMGENK